MTGDHEPFRDAPSSATENRSAELSRHMRLWRHRLDPSTGPGSAGTRRKRRLSQEDVAQMAGTSAYWYGTLERGQIDSAYSDDLLDRVAYALRLNPDERRVLYLYAVNREPLSRDLPSEPQLNDVLRRFIDRQPWPAYASNESWDYLAYNDRLVQWFPATGYNINIMWWVFTYPEARHLLYDWEGTWAPLMLAQMRMASAANPDNQRLKALIAEILRVNRYARDLWEHQATVYVHPDGDRRKLYVAPDDTLLSIEIVALAPLRAPKIRLIAMVTLDD